MGEILVEKKHRNRKLIVAGAIVLLLTFIAKDVLHDSMKESLDGLKSAAYLYHVSEYSLKGDTQLQRERDEFLKTTNSITGDPGKRNVESAQIENARLIVLQKISELRQYDETVRALIYALPCERRGKTPTFVITPVKPAETELRCPLNIADNELSMSANDIASIQKLWNEHPMEGTFDDSLNLVPIFDLKKAADAGRRTFNSCTTREMLLAKAGKAAKDAADREIRAEDKSLRVVAWLSYLFYAVGWTLTLSGRLLGIDGVGGE